ncbi:MAG: hypothetical protein ACI8ZO_000818 [Flavobacteriales bacterium]|jgi:hypothetical protein
MIYCDTCIWYELHGENHSNPIKSGLKASLLNMLEISTSKTLYERPIIFQRAISNLLKYPQVIIPEDPIQHIIKVNDPSFKSNPSLFEKLQTEFKTLNNTDLKKFEEIINETKKELKDRVANFDSPLKEIVNLINKESPKIKGHIKSSSTLKSHRKINTLDLTKEVIKNLVNSNTKHLVDWTRYDWTKINVFVHVLDITFKKLETGELVTFSINDFYDILHFVYVQPEDTFWTLETRWNTLLSSNSLGSIIYKENL